MAKSGKPDGEQGRSGVVKSGKSDGNRGGAGWQSQVSLMGTGEERGGKVR